MSRSAEAPAHSVGNASAAHGICRRQCCLTIGDVLTEANA